MGFKVDWLYEASHRQRSPPEFFDGGNTVGKAVNSVIGQLAIQWSRSYSIWKLRFLLTGGTAREPQPRMICRAHLQITGVILHGLTVKELQNLVSNPSRLEIRFSGCRRIWLANSQAAF